MKTERLSALMRTVPRTVPNSRTAVDIHSELELYDRRHDNFLRIEHHDNCVVIRSERARFSNAAKDALIRYLANEGFIGSGYCWRLRQANSSAPGVIWLTDNSWVRLKHLQNRLQTRARDFLTWGRLLSVGLFVVMLAISIWLKSHPF
jgi:hypothetical protein